MTSSISFLYKENNRDPSKEPWGTPEGTEGGFKETACFQFSILDDNQ